jgi:ParB-like chromosome segregation protein Spo0J
LAGIRKTAGKEGQSMEKLQIVYLPPGDLKPYEKNARKHAPDDIEAIKKSILEDGFNDPIATWNGVIVEGHGRQIAAQELGLETVPVIRLDHLSDKQRREYMIRHNRTAELSAWDFQTLEEECAALAIEGQEFPELNLAFADHDALDDLFAPAPEQGEKEAKQIQCPHCGEWFTP